MIPHGVEVFVALDTIDLRWSFDRLGALVADRLGREVRGGALFVFFGRRRDAVKLLFADDSGLCLFYNQPSSHYTSFVRGRGPWTRPRGARIAAARSPRRSHRLLCFLGRFAGFS